MIAVLDRPICGGGEEGNFVGDRITFILDKSSKDFENKGVELCGVERDLRKGLLGFGREDGRSSSISSSSEIPFSRF